MSLCHVCHRTDWKDEPAPQRAPGWIKTVCRKCGRFIGYRPPQVQKSKPLK